jgi:hypothetical protein
MEMGSGAGVGRVGVLWGERALAGEFLGRPKSSLLTGLSPPSRLTGSALTVRRSDSLDGNIPSSSSILRFCGLKSAGPPGEYARLLGLCGTLGLGGRKESSGKSLSGPGRQFLAEDDALDMVEVVERVDALVGVESSHGLLCWC